MCGVGGWGAQSVARQPGGNGRDGNVCQPQVMVRRAFYRGGNRKEVDAQIDPALLAHDLLRGQRFAQVMVPALVVVGEPEQGPVGVREPDVGHKIAHEHPGGSALTAPMVGQGPMHGGPAARRGAKVRGLFGRQGDLEKEPVHRGRPLAGRRHVEIHVDEAVELDVCAGRQMQPGDIGRAREICFRLDVAEGLGVAGLDFDFPAVFDDHQAHRRGKLGHAAVDDPPGHPQAVKRKRAVPHTHLAPLHLHGGPRRNDSCPKAPRCCSSTPRHSAPT